MKAKRKRHSSIQASSHREKQNLLYLKRPGSDFPTYFVFRIEGVVSVPFSWINKRETFSTHLLVNGPSFWYQIQKRIDVLRFRIRQRQLIRHYLVSLVSCPCSERNCKSSFIPSPYQLRFPSGLIQRTQETSRSHYIFPQIPIIMWGKMVGEEYRFLMKTGKRES